ncbi:hypothetical protein ACN6MT_20905 [Neobacillus niacini]|uniref:hypothetical protein n=1 Tax=Neobacillus niacini TaxID=86668 RepID=UPI003B016A2B
MILNELTIRFFTKLAGAGLTMFVIFTFLLLQNGFDMYEFGEAISSKYIWMVIYLYGIFCSLLIDFLEWKIPRINIRFKILLYVVAGYAIFLINGVNVFTLIAGTIGAFCSLLFYLGTYLSERSKGTQFACAILVPIFLMILMNIDFTKKIHWNEVKEDTTFKATFQYFDGKHDIPITIQAGQTINISIKYDNRNGGGYGYHVLNPKDKLVGMAEVNEGVMKFTAPETGVYRVIVKGDDLKGGVQVNWKINKTK